MAVAKGNRHIIKSVNPGSIAEELELEPGDEVLRINGKKIEDVFDYHYLCNDEYLTLIVRKANGEEWELEIEKELQDDLGINFEDSLMDKYHSCRNKCIFCFIDQLPPGMRETLYFKDDDARLSFLQGNYITLTNMSDEDVDRICFYKLSPINISIHTMNPELRCMMLHNRFAGQVLGKIQKFYEAGIEMNSQIVLCKGINDGAELDYSISELAKLFPYMRSVSVVPFGATKFRDNLYPLEKYNKEESKVVLAQLQKWQDKFLKEFGTRFIQASDEWFMVAEEPLPEADYYEGYQQIENGVGIIRSMMDEFTEELDRLEGDDRVREVSTVSGVLSAPAHRQLLDKLMKKFPNVKVHLYTIINDFFGHGITVTGLITGGDLIRQLTDQPLGEELLLPAVMLRPEEQDFLDDVKAIEVQKALQTPIRIVKSNGVSMVRAILGLDEPEIAIKE